MSFGDVVVEKHTKSKPDAEISYTGTHPHVLGGIFATPWKKSCVRVYQGFAGLSSDGTPLYSEGFSNCIVMILRGPSWKSALFHINLDIEPRECNKVEEVVADYLNGTGLGAEEKQQLLSTMHEVATYKYPTVMSRPEFQKKMETLNKQGVLKACFVIGSNGYKSTKNRVVDSLLGYLGVCVHPDIFVDSGDVGWAIVYVPKKSKIYVYNPNNKKVLRFSF